MTPTLIVLGLLAFGVAIVVFATRQRGPASAQAPVDPETGWDASFTPEKARTESTLLEHGADGDAPKPDKTKEVHG